MKTRGAISLVATAESTAQNTRFQPEILKSLLKMNLLDSLLSVTD